jgi:hypothetical protein
MQDEVLPVTGIFLDRASAESAAEGLRAEGLPVEVHSIAESNPATFPLSEGETNVQLLKAVIAEPIFVLIGASLGILAGLLLVNALAGILATVAFAFAGALVGLWLGDRPPARYRDYARDGAVMLSVQCRAEQQHDVIGKLRKAHAVEVGAAHSFA